MFSLMCCLVPAPSDSPAFVFPGAGGKLVPIVKSQFVSVFRDLLRRAEIPDSDHFRGHSFCHGAASWAFYLGVPEEISQVYSNWASDAYKSYLEFSFSAKLQLAQRMHLALSP